MDASHARPMTAYAALCAAAVVVLVQGVAPTGSVADSIARAGGPAPMYVFHRVSDAAQGVTDLSSRVGEAVASAVVPVVQSVVPAHDAHTAAGARSTSGTQHASATVSTTSPAPAHTTEHTGSADAPSTVAPRTAPTPADRHHAQAHRKADHASARAQRKSEHAAAQAQRKADHDAAKADRKADRAAARAARHHKH